MPDTSFFEDELAFFAAHEAADIAAVRPDDHDCEQYAQRHELPVAEHRVEDYEGHGHGHGAEGYIAGDEHHHEEAGHGAEQRQERQRNERAYGGGHTLAALESEEGRLDVAHDSGQSYEAVQELIGQDMYGDENRERALHDVAEQREHAAGPAAEAGHIGGADIAAAGLARVDAFDALCDDETEGDGTEKECTGHAEGKSEIGHKRSGIFFMDRKGRP